jgi:hypothetical protein
MDKELAKKLRDSGFPIPPPPDWVEKESHNFKGVIWGSEYEPTLETLIEACGDNFTALYREEKGWICVYNGTPIIDWDQRGIGSTPLEAVANLWFALNKK